MAGNREELFLRGRVLVGHGCADEHLVADDQRRGVPQILALHIADVDPSARAEGGDRLAGLWIERIEKMRLVGEEPRVRAGS